MNNKWQDTDSIIGRSVETAMWRAVKNLVWEKAQSSIAFTVEHSIWDIYRSINRILLHEE